MKWQRGFIKVPTTGELLGCLAVIAAFFLVIGIVLAIVAPKVWAWFKPLIQAALT